MSAWSVRGGNPFGYMPSVNYSQTNYGRIAEGNADNSFGPWIDPELQRRPHRRRSMLNMHKRRKRLRSEYSFIGV
jgi:hypothetical protein